MKYIIYADEAWTQSLPLYRYFCFFGGLLSTKTEFDIFEDRIKKIKNKFNYKKEIKWSNISTRHIDFYNELLIAIEYFIDSNKETKYRQMFMDRAIKYTGPKISDLESQFKVYYQFLKHCFGFGFCKNRISVIYRLDTHSSYHNKKKLISYVKTLYFQNVDIKIEFIDSKKSIPLQVCDLLMGAAGYYGNNISWDLLTGKKRRTVNQKMKSDFGKRVYDLLRRIDNSHRKSKAFNWFETTGMDGNPQNRYDHKLRIWKFIPKEHEIDANWQDDAFGKNKVRKKTV